MSQLRESLNQVSAFVCKRISSRMTLTKRTPRGASKKSNLHFSRFANLNRSARVSRLRNTLSGGFRNALVGYYSASQRQSGSFDIPQVGFTWEYRKGLRVGLKDCVAVAMAAIGGLLNGDEWRCGPLGLYVFARYSGESFETRNATYVCSSFHLVKCMYRLWSK